MQSYEFTHVMGSIKPTNARIQKADSRIPSSLGMLRLAIATFSCLANFSFGQGPVEWHEPFPPHRIAESLYYVGSRGLSTYLITTPQGHIVINSSFERTVPLIQASVEKLGFRFTDVKILLASHAHSDHVAGHALVRQLTGAKVYVMQGDEGVISTGGEGQYLYEERWKPCPVDRVLHDGDKVTLGDVSLTAHLTPGHTRGCTTWSMQAKEGKNTYQVVIIGSPNVNPGYSLSRNSDYSEIAEDFARTFKVLKSLPCDIFLGAHGNYYGMEAKHGRLNRDAGTNPFVDPTGYRTYVAEREKFYLRVLKIPALFTASPINLEDFSVFVPMGMVVGGHVTPIDHAYFYPRNWRSSGEVDVHAPGDGTIINISFEDQTQNVLGPHNFANAVLIEYPGGIKVTFLLMTRLSDRILKEVGGKLPVQSRKRIRVRAGEVIGKVGGRSLDFAVTDENATLTGFVNPRSYEGESWKIHTVDPFLYFDERIKTAILSKNVRPVEPRGGKIDYDIDGRLVGNWFQSGTGGYGGGGRGREYWKGHLAFVYDHIDPRFIRVSVGNYAGEAKQFDVKGNSPDPATVAVTSGLIKYELVTWNYYNSETGEDWNRSDWQPNLVVRNYDDHVMGTVLVQMIANRKVRFQAFPGKKASEVSSFDDNARIYER